MLRPERSLPHRPPTRIIIIIYKLTVLPIMPFKKNYNKINTRLTNSIYILMVYQVYELQILVSVEKIIVVIEKQSIIGIYASQRPGLVIIDLQAIALLYNETSVIKQLSPCG